MDKLRDKLKLKWKIFSFLLVFCAVLLIILSIFQTVLLDDMYKLIRRYEINQAITLVEKNINSEDLGSIILNLNLEKGITVSPSKDFKVPSNPLDYKDKRPETITVIQNFTLSDGSLIPLTFHATVTPVNSTVKTLQIQLIIISLIMIICSIVLALILSSRISKPIVNLNNSAKKLAQGNYARNFNASGFLEVYELSNTLNYTATELSKVDGLRRELMANISHDLRTPLALIYSYSELMQDFPEEITADKLQVIMSETKRLSSLVDDVLDLSKLESGNFSINPEKYNLTQSLRDTIFRVCELVKNSGFNIDFVYTSDTFVYADEVKLTQVFYNLLTNAINYSGDNKNICVKQEISNNIVKISVIDNGVGIALEDLSNIWDRYYKIDKNHKRAITGSGIGLSIVKQIFELSNINYGVSSTFGEGTCFWFELETNQI